MGDSVGTVGLDGEGEGRCDGNGVEGVLDAVTVGLKLGVSVGDSVGNSVGAMDGDCVVGANEGDSDGSVSSI